MARGGGLITRDDLARYQAKWRDPIGITYRGHTIYTMPPPSGGGVTLAEILRSEEHTSELQSQSNLVCRLLLEKKNLSVFNPCKSVAKNLCGVRDLACL